MVRTALLAIVGMLCLIAPLMAQCPNAQCQSGASFQFSVRGYYQPPPPVVTRTYMVPPTVMVAPQPTVVVPQTVEVIPSTIVAPAGYVLSGAEGAYTKAEYGPFGRLKRFETNTDPRYIPQNRPFRPVRNFLFGY